MLSYRKLQDRISELFYQHGLFCASHPYAIITFVIITVLCTCYPLTRLPLPGDAPLQYATSIEGYSPPLPVDAREQESSTDIRQPRWYFGEPAAYIQQFVVKSVLSPWDPQRLLPADAFRSSLTLAFDIVDSVENLHFSLRNVSVSLSDVCLRVAEPSGVEVRSVFPQYDCLTLSPTNLWHRDRIRFLEETDLIGRLMKNSKSSFDASISIRDIVFGIPWKDSGIRKYYFQNRQRIITFAVTLVLRKYDEKFIQALRNKLMELYPQSQPLNNSSLNMIHVHYQIHNYVVEYTPLMVAYIVLLLYLYFSVRKIEMVKSKWGLAFSAMMTVIASLLMSVSLCVFIGLTPTLNGSEIFPYLVVVIGLENILVVTKSVVNTPAHLEVKMRLAQGLSKEGWYIFKNLMTELLILAVGFFTFVPAIQEFCLFAVLGLGSDCFLQMFFFTTVLSIDIRRMELSDLHRHGIHDAVRRERTSSRSSEGVSGCPVMRRFLNSSTSVFTTTNPFVAVPSDAPAVRRTCSSADWTDIFYGEGEISSRRMKFFNFWAKYRMVQRGIMACVLIWILLIVYKTGLTDDIEEVELNEQMIDRSYQHHNNRVDESHPSDSLLHDDMEPWRRLSSNHWKVLFNYYNISLLGRYISILPTVHLSASMSSEQLLRRPPNNVIFPAHFLPKFTWSRMTSELDHPSNAGFHPLYLMTNLSSPLELVVQRLIRYPRSRTEFFLTIILCIFSFILLMYFLLVLYRCMCTRNYAKWRSSWKRKQRFLKNAQNIKEIRNSVPLVLAKHKMVFDELCL